MYKMILYIIPFLIFIISTVIMYVVSRDKDKKKPKTILIRNVLPSVVIAALTFVIIKFKDTGLFTQEKIMTGNYFD